MVTLGKFTIYDWTSSAYAREFVLYAREKIGYKGCVPICPSCHATIHPGAVERCPVCGYSLKRAEAVFGTQALEFTRVVDEAGVLTHSERRELMEALEDMERNIPPVALGIFITSHGQMKQFRAHAHWALNHAVIHHPSFGKREAVQAIEDADLAMGHGRLREDEHERIGVIREWWKQLRKNIRDFIHPYPPPVRQEWMLILALDVQLEVACFTWGYMLDPYINPDSINSSIIGARLYFRERATAVGLRKVMKSAVTQLAARSHSVNKRMRKPILMRSVAVAMGVLAGSLQAAPETALPDDAAAEEVTEGGKDPGAQTPAKPEAKEEGGNPATPHAAPKWSHGDYVHLLSGEIPAAYRMLTDAGGTPPPPGGDSAPKDERISKRFYQGYTSAQGQSILDPQELLNRPEREDVEYTLRRVNANSGYHLYIAFFRTGQEIPMELAAGALARSVAQPGEYTVMLMYGVGDSPQIELGYHELNLTDTDRHAWLDRVRHAALVRGGGVEGVLAAVQELNACLAPVAEQLPPLEQRADMLVPLIPIQMREEDEAEDVTLGDELRQMIDNPSMRPIAVGVASVMGSILLVLGGLWWLRRSGRLIKSEPDVRLSSPYGAGVSRNVNYLEGREEKKPNRLF